MPQAMPVQTNTVTIPDYRPFDRTPTSLMPVDPSLFKNPLESFMQGAEHGLKLGSEIAEMPNAAEKLKAARQLTQNTEWAMAHPDEAKSQGYAMGPNGPQFRGTDVQMMPDVTNRRALEEARARQAGAGVGLTNAQVAEAQANAQEVRARTGLMPLKEAAPGQKMLNVDAYGRPMPGTYNQSGGINPPVNGPGNTAGGNPPVEDQSTGNAPSTITVPKFTPPQPGHSTFSPDQVKAWWGANWSDTIKKTEWSPVYNNGQGGWVLTHGDGSKDVVTDSLIQQNKGKWSPDLPLADALKLSAIQRQAGQLPNAPTLPAGYQDPQSLASDEAAFSGPDVSPSAAQSTLQAAGAAPQATAVTGSQGAAPVSPNQQVMPGAPVPTASNAMPGTTPAAPGQAPIQLAQNPLEGWKDPNAADFGATRHIIGMQGNKPIIRPDTGEDYILAGLEQDGTEMRQPLNGLTPPERVTPLSAVIKQKNVTSMLKLQDEMRDMGKNPEEMNYPQMLQAKADAYALKTHEPLPEPTQRRLDTLGQVLSNGYALQQQVSSMSQAQRSPLAMMWNSAQDRAGGLLGQSNQDLAQMQKNWKEFKGMLGRSVGEGRMSGPEMQAIIAGVGDPYKNPQTFVQGFNSAYQRLQNQYVNEVNSALEAKKYTVPKNYLETAGWAYKHMAEQPNSGVPANAGGSVAAGNKPVTHSQAEEDALPPNTHFIAVRPDGTQVPAMTTNRPAKAAGSGQ